MRVVDRIEQVRKELARPTSVGLVPTMGALHDGHLSLVRRSVAECDLTLVTVFVNPLQFGPAEDFTRYPRDLDADVRAAAGVGADLVFAPSVDEMYGSTEPTVRVVVDGELGSTLEGATRPGHFDGVATVVTKLFGITGPCRAYFGEKDWQQLQVVRRLVTDLSLPVDVVACPTVREPDGLALSSRNRYLSPDERRAATVLYRALITARPGWADVVATEPLVRLDYAAEAWGRRLIAAWVGSTRLIDNVAAVA